MPRKKSFILFFFCVLTFYAGYGQTDTTTVRASAKIDDLKNEIRTFIREFSDINMLDNSLQVRHQGKVREIKKQAKQEQDHNHDYSQNGFPVGLKVYTKLNVDELWAKWLTGKWWYTEHGKIRDPDFVYDYPGVDLTFHFDTLEDREHFKVTPQARLNQNFLSFLEGLGRNSETFEDSLNQALPAFFPNGIDYLEQPKQAEIDTVVVRVYGFLKQRTSGFWSDLVTKTENLKHLYDKDNIRKLAKSLDETIASNETSANRIYIVDPERRTFIETEFEHFNIQLGEVNPHLDRPLYIIQLTTDYVYRQSELEVLSDKVLAESKHSRSDIDLIVANTFKNDQFEGFDPVTLSCNIDDDLFDLLPGNYPVTDKELLFGPLQAIVSILYQRVLSKAPEEEMPVTGLLTFLNHVEPKDVEQMRAGGYDYWFNAGLESTSTEAAPVSGEVGGRYTASGIPIKPVNGSTFYTKYDFQYVDAIESNGQVYRALYGILNFGGNEPRARFYGFWSEEFKEKINSEGRIRLDKARQYLTPGQLNIALKGRDYEICGAGEWALGAFMDAKSCQLELAEYQLFGSPEYIDDSLLNLCGFRQNNEKPEGTTTANYNLLLSHDLEELEDNYTCAIGRIYARNGYGKRFLESFLNKTYQTQWADVVEIADLYDNEDYLSISTLSRETLSFKVSSYLFFTEKAIEYQQGKVMEAIRGEITWHDYKTFLNESIDHFNATVQALKTQNNANQISDDILGYLSEHQLLTKFNYDERLRLLKILAEDGFGEEEDAAMKLIYTFAQGEEVQIRFLDDLQQPLNEDSEISLLQELDEVFYDKGLGVENDHYHAFASLVSVLAMNRYFTDAKKTALENSENPLQLISFYQYDDASWGYNVHQYSGDFNDHNTIDIGYKTDFQYVQGFTGEAINAAIPVVFGGVPRLLYQALTEEGNGYDVSTTFDPLQDFVFVFVPDKDGNIVEQGIFPVYYVKYLSSTKSSERFDYYADLAIQGITITASVATLGGASPLMVAVETASIANACVNIVATMSGDMGYLEDTTVELIQDVTMVVDMVSLGVNVPLILKKAPDAFQSLQRFSSIDDYGSVVKVGTDAVTAERIETSLSKLKGKVDDVLRRGGGGLADDFTDLAYAWKDGWTKEKVLAIPKGQRPDPSVYLKQSYIDAHLRKFEEGASYLVPKDILDRFGRDILGWPDNTQFVMSKNEMDQLLTKTGNDINEICKELGINPDDWTNRPLVRIDIADPKSLHLRMPTGNEAGANPKWLPGGLLPTGNMEAVIDNIPIGKYIELDI